MGGLFPLEINDTVKKLNFQLKTIDKCSCQLYNALEVKKLILSLEEES